jgi:hypothetical protein
MYPVYWVPYIRLPFWAALPLLALMGFRSFRWLRSLWGKQGAAIDCGRARRELGLELLPLEQVGRWGAQRLLVRAADSSRAGEGRNGSSPSVV